MKILRQCPNMNRRQKNLQKKKVTMINTMMALCLKDTGKKYMFMTFGDPTPIGLAGHHGTHTNVGIHIHGGIIGDIIMDRLMSLSSLACHQTYLFIGNFSITRICIIIHTLLIM